MENASNNFRSEIVNQLGYLVQIAGNGTLLDHNGRNWVAINVEKMGIHTIVTIGTRQFVNKQLGWLTDEVLVALGYRLIP